MKEDRKELYLVLALLAAWVTAAVICLDWVKIGVSASPALEWYKSQSDDFRYYAPIVAYSVLMYLTAGAAVSRAIHRANKSAGNVWINKPWPSVGKMEVQDVYLVPVEIVWALSPISAPLVIGWVLIRKPLYLLIYGTTK